LPLFWDMSLQISNEYIRNEINGQISSSLQINSSGYRATLTRISSLSCELKGNAIRAKAKWKLDISSTGTPSEFYIQFYIKQYSDGLRIKTTAVKGLVYLNDQLREIDPFKMLPITERSEVKNEANKKFSETVEKINISIPANNLNGQQLSFVPASFLFEDAVYIFSRTQQRGKIRYPLVLHQPFLGYQMLMAIRKEHIIPILASIVSARGATMLSATFYHGRIELDSYGSKSDSFLHISVKGKVWMGHRITLTTSLGELRYQASWSYWKYSIKANLCWPVCGKVIDEATDAVMKVIESRKFFNGSISSSIPGKFSCRITPNTLHFYFN